MSELPRGPRLFVAKLGDGWAHEVRHGAGVLDATVRRPARPDESAHGVNVQEVVQVPCESVAVLGRHTDGRAFAAVWVRRLDLTASGAERKWTSSEVWAWRVCADPDCPGAGRHPGELPRQVGLTALADAVRELSAASDSESIEEVA